MRGELVLEGTREGLQLIAEGSEVATIVEPSDPTSDRWEVRLHDGRHWEIRFSIPRSAEVLVEAGEWESIGLPELTAWATEIEEGGVVLGHAEIGVSSKTLAPTALRFSTDSGEVVVHPEAEWSAWSIDGSDRSIGRVAIDDGIVLVLDGDLGLETVLLIAANAVAVAGNRTRPLILTAKRMERKTRESLRKKHGSSIDEATAAGHQIQYFSTWESGVVYGWFECLVCGRTASTFESLGGGMRGAMGFGTTKGKLKGRLLDETCPGRTARA